MTTERLRYAPGVAPVHGFCPTGHTAAMVRVARVPVSSWWSRLALSSTHVGPLRSTTSVPTSAFALCLTLSAGMRLTPPNAIGVAVRLYCPPTLVAAMSPAYHGTVSVLPGGVRPASGLLRPRSFRPTSVPSARLGSYCTSCGCRPMNEDGWMRLVWNVVEPSSPKRSRFTTPCSVLKVTRSGVLPPTRLRSVTVMQSPALARSTIGSIGVVVFLITTGQLMLAAPPARQADVAASSVIAVVVVVAVIAVGSVGTAAAEKAVVPVGVVVLSVVVVTVSCELISNADNSAALSTVNGVRSEVRT